MITATISNSSPRHASWLRIFGADTVQILSPVPTPGTSPHHNAPDGARFYRLDVAALTAQQRARLIAENAEKFDLDESEVERDLDDPDHGVPILADDVSITLTGEHARMLLP